MSFITPSGQTVPSVTADQMREVDRIAVEQFQLGILQMMENAGRALAEHALAMLADAQDGAVVVAGGGGNGGGGLCCARHLHNHGIKVSVILARPPARLSGPARSQLATLMAAGAAIIESHLAPETIQRAALVVDALIGYGLRDAPAGETARLIELCNQHARQVLSNDIPSGMNATTGERPGVAIRADRTVTLAAPKTGLAPFQGDLFLADIGIPDRVFTQLGILFTSPFKDSWTARLHIRPATTL